MTSVTSVRPVPCLMDNKPLRTNKTFSVKDMGEKDGKVLYEVNCVTVKEVENIVVSAQTAFQNWKQTTIQQRRTIFLRAIELLKERMEMIVNTIVKETVVGKGFARYQVEKGAISHLEECMTSLAEALKATVLPETQPGVRKYVYYQPFGVVLGIAPWNAPFVLALRSVLWAIAAGNTAILKTSEYSPLTHLLVAEILIDAKLPSGVLSIVHVSPEDAAEVTEAFISHKSIKKINFTGSTRVGRMIAIKAAQELKPIVLELGGKAPAIVLQDADLDLAANNIIFGGFLNTNQICMAVNNIFVHESVKEVLVQKLKDIFVSNKQTFQAGFETTHQIRSLFTESSANRLKGLYTDAVDKGASVAVGKVGFEGALVQPIILKNVKDSMEIYTEESFGPVLSIITFKEEEEVIKLVNEQNAGLAACIFSKNVEKAFRIAQTIQAGQVHVNSHSVHDHGLMQHGGWKQSGYGRLGGGVEGIREFTQSQGFTVQAGTSIPLHLM